MCGLRPGELSGLRWAHLDIDSDDPHLVVAERANEVNKRYVGQAEPKTSRKGGIHEWPPLSTRQVGNTGSSSERRLS